MASTSGSASSVPVSSSSSSSSSASSSSARDEVSVEERRAALWRSRHHACHDGGATVARALSFRGSAEWGGAGEASSGDDEGNDDGDDDDDDDRGMSSGLTLADLAVPRSREQLLSRCVRQLQEERLSLAARLDAALLALQHERAAHDRERARVAELTALARSHRAAVERVRELEGANAQLCVLAKCTLIESSVSGGVDEDAGEGAGECASDQGGGEGGSEASSRKRARAASPLSSALSVPSPHASDAVEAARLRSEKAELEHALDAARFEIALLLEQLRVVRRSAEAAAASAARHTEEAVTTARAAAAIASAAAIAASGRGDAV